MGSAWVLVCLLVIPGVGASEGPWDLDWGELDAPEAGSSAPPDAPSGSLALSGDCEPHPGIRVTGDEGSSGFAWTNPATGVREPRPGSGVQSGSGTEEDPYVIAGWCLGATGIEISDTRAHFIVRENIIQGNGLARDDAGIRIENASHATIQGNRVDGSGFGIGVWRSADIKVVDNRLENNLWYGAWVAESEEVTIRDNTARSNDNGIGIGLSHGALVSDNIARHNLVTGFLNAFSDDAVIRDNQFAHNDLGVYVREASGVTVAGNTMEEHRGNGLAFDLSPRGLAEENEVTGSGGEGIIFWGSPDGRAIGNEAANNGFADDRHGIRMAFSPNSTVLGNVVGQNAHGVGLDASPESRVEGNLMQGNQADGLTLWDAAGTQATHNQITDNGVGVSTVGDTTGLRVNGNNIHENRDGAGLDADRAEGIVDATGNWWGCPRGPDHEDCDAVRGGADISPWLRTPDRDAPGPDPGQGGAPGAAE